jgi:hypothetical protein
MRRRKPPRRKPLKRRPVFPRPLTAEEKLNNARWAYQDALRKFEEAKAEHAATIPGNKANRLKLPPHDLFATMGIDELATAQRTTKQDVTVPSVVTSPIRSAIPKPAKPDARLSGASRSC